MQDWQINNYVLDQGLFKPQQASFTYLTSNIKYFSDTVWPTGVIYNWETE
jgi:hypothetical protein